MDEHNHKKEKFRNEDDHTRILTGNKMFARGMPGSNLCLPAFLPRGQWSTIQNGDFRALPDGAIPQHSGFLMLLN